MKPRRGARAAEWTGFENRRPSRVRGFKSHPLRHSHFPILRHALPVSPTVAKLPARGEVAEWPNAAAC